MKCADYPASWQRRGRYTAVHLGLYVWGVNTADQNSRFASEAASSIKC